MQSKGSLPALQQLRQDLLLHSPLALERLEWIYQAGEIRLWLSLVSLNPEGLQQQQEQLKASLAPELNLQALDWEPSPEVVEQGSWLLRIGVEPQRADDLLGLAAIKPWTLQLGAASGLGLATGQAASHQVAALRQHCELLGGYLTVLQAPKAKRSRPGAMLQRVQSSRRSNANSTRCSNSAAAAYRSTPGVQAAPQNQPLHPQDQVWQIEIGVLGEVICAGAICSPR